MDTFLFFFFTVAYSGLLIWALVSSPKQNFWSLRIFLYFVLIGLIYDNLIIASGKFIGEGDLLETLNLMRYWTHAMFTPTLVLFSLGVLRSAGIKGAHHKLTYYIALLYTGLLIFIEIITEIIGLELQAISEYGVLRYGAVEEGGGPPLMILGITIVLLLAGLLLWITSGWAWMFIGAVIMTIGSVVSIPVESGAVTNGFELILLTSLVLTKLNQERK